VIAPPPRPEDDDAPPFGAYAPGPAAEAVRALLARLPDRPAARRLALVLRRLAGTRARRPYDVTVFGDQRARLYPYDNRCEKWAYAMPQLWDAPERAALGAAIAASDPARSFVFVDAGANVGLYCLFARSAARKAERTLQALAIEPAAEVRARLRANLAFSGAHEIAVAPAAVAAAPGPVRLAVDAENRGESRLSDADDAQTVRGAPLAALVAEAGLAHVDGLKIDIEGGEAAALTAYFSEAPPEAWPQLIIAETHGRGHVCATRRACLERGYEVQLVSGLNTVFVRKPAP